MEDDGDNRAHNLNDRSSDSDSDSAGVLVFVGNGNGRSGVRGK